MTDIPARIHLLPAKQAPSVVILRRKPSRYLHVMLWNTVADKIDHGSWFQGNFDFWGCDLSWDGQYLVYGAQSTRKWESWMGVCKAPWLKSLKDFPTQSGVCTAYWSGPGELARAGVLDFLQAPIELNPMRLLETLFPGAFGVRQSIVDSIPFKVKGMPSETPVEPLPPNFAHRLERDGWKRVGAMPSELRKWYVDEPMEGDPGWAWKFSPAHPELKMHFLGNVPNRGYVFSFELDGSNVVADAEWATWTSNGDLILAKKGAVERYSLKSLKKGKPDFREDFEGLVPPNKEKEKAAH